jgi:hypothetical protein
MFPGEMKLTPIDLSKATKLKDVVFQLESRGVKWVIAALRTITPKHRDLRQIRIDVSFNVVLLGAGANVPQAIGEANYRQWLDLDRFLVQFWESHSIRPKFTSTTERDMRKRFRRLLPEITKRGIIDILEY